MHNSRRKERAPQRELALQVVPLIDIMFLLLLFFMLGADMSVREAELLTLRAVAPPLCGGERAGRNVPIRVRPRATAANAAIPRTGSARCSAASSRPRPSNRSSPAPLRTRAATAPDRSSPRCTCSCAPTSTRPTAACRRSSRAPRAVPSTSSNSPPHGGPSAAKARGCHPP
ncbi:MAG: biopolymer transporter ExbD [Planctomycetes bacterium]|nr:biopolymer transporter ExbD [Planctomycetota bacterium]